MPNSLLASCQLIIFDKDGTLIHFDAMWGGWVQDLAQRLEQASGRAVSAALFDAMGYDLAAARVHPHGKLAATPMAQLRVLTVDVMREAGVSSSEAEAAVEFAWHIPDPVILAKPFTDLRALFTALRARGLRIAIATTDDRTPTEAMVNGLHLAEFIDTMICADDGIPVKPQPDMIDTICHRLNVPVSQTMMIGDSVPDVQMGRAAGVGRVVGVLTGVGTAEVLAPYADVILPSIADLL
jgi:phosphoglycolate phosphatase-like HAD superfamily hydrolase